MTFDYDLFVIGGGSGGVRAARIDCAPLRAYHGALVCPRSGAPHPSNAVPGKIQTPTEG